MGMACLLSVSAIPQPKSNKFEVITDPNVDTNVVINVINNSNSNSNRRIKSEST